MSTRTTSWKIATAGVVALFFSAAAAEAAPSLSFDDDEFQTQGTISYDSNDGFIVGDGISFFSVTGIDTPLNAGVTLVCNSGDGSGLRDQNNPCFLDFETATLTSEGSSAAGDPYVFGPGGDLAITGTLEDSGGVVRASGNLVSGEFHSGSFTTVVGDNTIFGAGGFDTKNPDLVSFYGLGPNFDFANTQINLSTNFTGSNFVAQVNNADFDNEPIPVPATFGFLGLGLLALGALLRRNKA